MTTIGPNIHQKHNSDSGAGIDGAIASPLAVFVSLVHTFHADVLPSPQIFLFTELFPSLII